MGGVSSHFFIYHVDQQKRFPEDGKEADSEICLQGSPEEKARRSRSDRRADGRSCTGCNAGEKESPGACEKGNNSGSEKARENEAGICKNACVA